VAIRVAGEVYPSPAESLPRNEQLAAKPQSYLTSYRYTCLPQARSASKITLLTGKDQSRIKNRKKADIFLIPVLKPLQVQKAISYHLPIPWELNAVRMLEAGIATREEIDNCMKLGLNYPIGPLALLDFNGIDNTYMVARAMYEETKDPQYAPPTLMNKIVGAGWLGRKTGNRFYEYIDKKSLFHGVV